MKVYLRFIPMVIIMGMIFYASHQPGDFLSLPRFIGADKLLHVIAYGGLAAAFAYGLHPFIHPSRAALAAAGVVAFCAIYGIGDEYHQSFIPGRFATAWDVLADMVGAVLAAGWWYRYRAGNGPDGYSRPGNRKP